MSMRYELRDKLTGVTYMEVCKTDIKTAAMWLRDAALFYQERAIKPKEEWRATQMRKLSYKLYKML